jgi:hypothetical protein
MYWYATPETLRDEMGYAGREWALKNGLTAEQMGQSMITMIDYMFETPRESRPMYTLTKVEKLNYKRTGIVA